MTLLSSLLSPLNAGIYQRFQFAPAQGATSVSGADANGNTLSYQPGYVEVMRNGLLLPFSDYTATNGTSITFANGMNSGDTVYVIALSSFSVANAVSPIQMATAVQGYLSGLTLSTAGSSATFSVAAGTAMDSTNADYLSLPASVSKTTSAWAAGSGNGAIDTGSVAASTWYHVHLIKNESIPAVDVLFSLSATSPTLPTGYTLSRRIGSMKTNGSSQWTQFTQYGNYFYWTTAVTDLNAASITTTDTAYTLSVPTGVRVEVFCNINIISAGASVAARFRSPDLEANLGAPLVTANAFADVGGSTNASSVFRAVGHFGPLITNTSAQINIQGEESDTVYLVTLGWSDTRGRDL